MNNTEVTPQRACHKPSHTNPWIRPVKGATSGNLPIASRDMLQAQKNLRSGPRTVVKSTSVFTCFEPLGSPCSCLKNQNSCAKIRSTPLDSLSEAIPCELLAYFCLPAQESCLTPHIAPASRAIDASPCPSLSRRLNHILLKQCLSFFEWECIYPGEQMILAPFLEKFSLDRAPGRSA